MLVLGGTGHYSSESQMQTPGVQKDNMEKMMGQLSVSGWWMRNVSVVSYILQKKSLNWTQSRRAASKLAS